MLTNEHVSIVDGAVLYDDGDHKFIWLGWEEEEEEGFVQVNQYIIINRGKGFLLDPGGVYVFPRVISNVSTYIDIDNIQMIFYSHQDPDVSSGIALWLANTPAEVYISNLWTRFVPHFGVTDIRRIKGIPDRGMTLPLPTGDVLEFIPAHYLHSVGQFNVYDRRSKILFSGDIGAAVFPRGERKVFVEDFQRHVPLMEGFHKRYMNGNVACRKWVNEVKKRDIDMIAPQHGSIFKKEDTNKFLDWLSSLRCGLDIINEIY
jgi:flavorubredoxin